ncbi:DUF3137 domain-containing protein [Maricaulis salignorans]|uniref:DUF3137 domain-containing protein n=1 Tax=Maricaulis salignorans TaxID=144026 RepID=A0A1G9PWX7_9PROT|nr:DUF3137 domain-containing protein [Maricaulis salignorans]SDM03266.1 Protein of unknown function [Maricaulis salignorans]
MNEAFQGLWRETLEPWLASLEAERKASVSRFIAWTAGMSLIGLAAGVYFYTREPEFMFPLIGTFFGLVAGMLIGGRRMERLRKTIKAELNTKIAEVCQLNYALAPSEPARFATFRAYGLLPSYTRCRFEDHFSGERLGCDFELYEAHLEERRRSGKSTHWVTVFRGVLIRINFPRKVEGVTVITRDAGIFNGLAALGRSFGSKKLERVALVDPEFEKAFEVYGTDQVLARYMLDPAFMERLVRLEKALKGKNVRAAFDEHSGEGELLIAAETGNQFEAGSMFKPLADEARIKTIIDDLTRVIDIIENLVKPPELGEGG